MKKGKGTPRRVTIKDLNGKVIGRYDSMEKARQAYYPEKYGGYISMKLYHSKNDNCYTDYDLGLVFVREGRGKYDIERRFRVIDRKTGKEKHYKNRTTMFKDIKGIGNAFNKQMRLFGNFKNDDYEIYPIS